MPLSWSDLKKFFGIICIGTATSIDVYTDKNIITNFLQVMIMWVTIFIFMDWKSWVMYERPRRSREYG